MKPRAMHGPWGRSATTLSDGFGSGDAVASSRNHSYSDSIQSIALGIDLPKILPALDGISEEIQVMKHEHREIKDFISKSISKVGGAENWMDSKGLKKYLAEPCENTIRDYISGKYGSPIPYHKVGNRLLFKPSEVDDWVKTWQMSKELSQF
jgi:hypothetical protein